MASWRDLEAYVRAHYNIAGERPGRIQLILETNDGRSQSVYLWHRRLPGHEDWLIIGSPFAEASRVDLNDILKAAGQMVVGGIVLVGKHLAVRHAVPLANLDTNEFERPLELVTLAADQLEQMANVEDRY